MNIRGILFDLDDTLIPSEKLYRLGLQAAHRRLRREVHLAWPAFLQLYGEARALIKSRLGSCPAARNRMLYFKQLVELALGSSRPRLALEVMNAFNRCWRSIDASETRRVAARLARRYHLGIITNQMALMQLQKMERLDPRGKWFKVLVTAEEVGVEKPGLPIYLLACHRMGIPADKILLVGNSWKSDVRGGLRAGMQVAYMCPGKPPAHMPYRTFHVPSLKALAIRMLG